MIFIGVSGKARNVNSPYVGVNGKSRRVLKGYIGVGGKARCFYDYLNDIDHVECEFYSVTGWTNISSSGGTKIWEGANAMGSNAALNVSGNTFNGINNSGSNAEVVYFNARLYAVLKGGYKLRLDYPYSSDNKGVSLTITQTASNQPSGDTYGIWLFVGGDDDNDGFYRRSQTNTSIEFVWDTNSYSVMFRLYRRYSAGFRIDKATINGRDYSVTVVRNLAS